MRTVLTGIAAIVGIVVLVAWVYSRAQAREREMATSIAGGDLHGLASVTLPRGYRALGLSGSNRSLTAEEQLLRHDQTTPLMFRFDRDARNDWGGHARDPELLNIVLLPPGERTDPDEALNNFSIGRYYSPMGNTIPLDSPRWNVGQDDRYRWRVLAMKDHFTVGDHQRWAIAMLDDRRGVRLDLFVLQKRMKQTQALTMLREIMDSIQLTPKLNEHFAQTGTVEERVDRLREANLAAMFAALRPYDLIEPTAGGIAFGRDIAVLLEDHRKAVRMIRVLASVTLPHGAATAATDKYGRPQLPFTLEAEQYPGPTSGGLPEVPLHMFYWNPALERWQRTRLQQATTNEEWPLTPLEAAVVTQLELTGGARDAVHVFSWRDYYQPPALDDTRSIGEFLEETTYWQRELLTGRIIGGELRSPTLKNP